MAIRIAGSRVYARNSHSQILLFCISGEQYLDNQAVFSRFSYICIISFTDISLDFNARMIAFVCFLHKWAVFKCYFDIIFARLHETQA